MDLYSFRIKGKYYSVLYLKSVDFIMFIIGKLYEFFFVYD